MCTTVTSDYCIMFAHIAPPSPSLCMTLVHSCVILAKRIDLPSSQRSPSPSSDSARARGHVTNGDNRSGSIEGESDSGNQDLWTHGSSMNPFLREETSIIIHYHIYHLMPNKDTDCHDRLG